MADGEVSAVTTAAGQAQTVREDFTMILGSAQDGIELLMQTLGFHGAPGQGGPLEMVSGQQAGWIKEALLRALLSSAMSWTPHEREQLATKWRQYCNAERPRRIKDLSKW